MVTCNIELLLSLVLQLPLDLTLDTLQHVLGSKSGLPPQRARPVSLAPRVHPRERRLSTSKYQHEWRTSVDPQHIDTYKSCPRSAIVLLVKGRRLSRVADSQVMESLCNAGGDVSHPMLAVLAKV
ncbi:hypothetical protein BDN67DRAFT_153371 [Paxillus ammoniavirescens]|nr:hypothetical protein BDN67DRAFT_153371 [Paxillus ammoniavirescens]